MYSAKTWKPEKLNRQDTETAKKVKIEFETNGKDAEKIDKEPSIEYVTWNTSIFDLVQSI